MIPGYDGLYASTDYPPEMPELAPAPKPAKSVWEGPPPLNREQYLAIGRPILKAAGFLKDEAVADKPALPKMPDTPKRVRKPRVAKPAAPPVAKPAADEERVPF